jgi:hypothetical protein
MAFYESAETGRIVRLKRLEERALPGTEFTIAGSLDRQTCKNRGLTVPSERLGMF